MSRILTDSSLESNGSSAAYREAACLTFDVVVKSGHLGSGRQSVTYRTRGQERAFGDADSLSGRSSSSSSSSDNDGDGTNFFIKYEKAGLLTVHHGTSMTGPIVGRVEVPRSTSKTAFTFLDTDTDTDIANDNEINLGDYENEMSAEQHADCNACSQCRSCALNSCHPLTQTFVTRSSQHGPRFYGCRLPAVDPASTSNLTWKQRQSGKGRLCGPLVDGNTRYVLTDESGLEYAVYDRTGSRGRHQRREAQLRLFIDEPAAVSQIVISCVAFTEIERENQQRERSHSAARGATERSAIQRPVAYADMATAVTTVLTTT